MDEPEVLTSVTTATLERSKSEAIAYHAPKSKMAWFSMSQFNCVVALACTTSPSLERRKRLRGRISNVIIRASNSYQVAHNPLTYLLSRDAFRSKLRSGLSQEVKLTDGALTEENRQPTLVTVMALDIDHFKQVNDTHGHLYGDQVLKAFAMRLEEVAQKIAFDNPDMLDIRVGHPSGEEFLIYIHGRFTRERIEEYANQFRTRISEEPLPSENEWLNLSMQENLSVLVPPSIRERVVTASIGVAIAGEKLTSQSPDEHVSILLDQADTALYRAKNAGRNQVILFESILSSCGRVLEQDVENRVIAIDIGKTVGVSLGQEFIVYPPGFTGSRKFIISDGRTTKVMGLYPKVESTRVTVFNVQAEISFAYISIANELAKNVAPGSHLEAVPSGSISHLLPHAAKYFGTSMDAAQVGDAALLQEFVKEHCDAGKLYAIVFNLCGAQEFVKKYGSGALNAALGSLFRGVTSTFYGGTATGIIDRASVCLVGQSQSSIDTKLRTFVSNISDELAGLGVAAGVFSKSDFEATIDGKKVSLDAKNAIEFARFAASENAGAVPGKITHFNHAIAHQIVFGLREAKAFKTGKADFDRFVELGVTSGALSNLGALIYASLGDLKRAQELHFDATTRDPGQLIFRSNFGTSSYQVGEFEKPLPLLNDLPDADIQKLKQLHPYGFVTYARLLARAKIAASQFFNKDRFNLVAKEALGVEGFKDSTDSQVIAAALALE